MKDEISDKILFFNNNSKIKNKSKNILHEANSTVLVIHKFFNKYIAYPLH